MTFTRLQDTTAEDLRVISQEFQRYKNELPQRLIEHMRTLQHDFGGFPVSRLEHCLQTATRVLEAGEDDEYVAVALLHDIGDTLCPLAHGELAAMILKPYVNDANYFLLRTHNDFQVYYYNHHLGLEKNLRQQHRTSIHYGYVLKFCETYDSVSFDPSYKSKPLEFFIPYVEKLINKTTFNTTDK